MQGRLLLLGAAARRRRILLFLPVLFGAIAGIFVLLPINEFVYWVEHDPEIRSWQRFVLGQLTDSLRGRTPGKALFYASIGALLGTVTSWIYAGLSKRTMQIQQLSAALEQDLAALIARGEGPDLEFKSSFRWDLKEGKTNRALEGVVLKTLAGFLNGSGGTLLIGVADDGKVLGVEHDFQTLKKRDRDGFEQAITTAVAAKLGTDVRQHIQVVFHSLDGRDVCRIIIARSPKPVYIRHDRGTKFYVRTGGSTREVTVQTAVDYIAQRW